VEHTVGLVDLAPTLLELLDRPALPETDGRSLTPLVTIESVRPSSWKAAYELESMYGRYAYGWEPPRALVKDGAKYIDLPRPELYDLASDPAETTDLLHPAGDGKPGGRSVRIARKLRTDLAKQIGLDAGGIPDPPAVSTERRAAMESLGYLGGSGGDTQDPDKPRIDPKDGIRWIEDLESGRRLCNSGKPEPGIDALRRLLARNPDNVPALLTLAGCNLALQRPEQAANACLLARKLAPNDSLVWFNLANARSMQGKGSKAKEAYERALELQPRFADAYLNYAAFLMRAGEDAAAAALLRRSQAQGVLDPDIEAELGVLLLKTGDVDGAMAGFRRALELNPHAQGPLRAMAMLHRKRGEEALAEQYERRLR